MKPPVNRAIGIFVATAGLLGVVVQLLTSPKPIQAISFVTLFGALLVLGLWIISRNIRLKLKTRRALPPIQKLEEICTGYTIEPATPDEVEWVAELEAEVYPPEDAVPAHVLKEWYGCNPTGFSIVRMGNGQKIGHIDILPVKPATLGVFLDGNIVERDIRGDSLFAPNESDRIKDLYVESIIVLPPKGLSNAPAILCLLSRFIPLVRRMCDPSKIENIYAIAASASGESLLRRLGFDELKRGQNRRDQHDVFAAKFDHLAANIAAICGDRLKDLELLHQITGRGTPTKNVKN